ncbi:N-acetylglucosamine kinase [Aequorivita sp. H23M31]|uniref:N-acetylglucosamine kinase n=1 Tax=Aequorivita ciconiae TaxID=2494375 RepID=A0A410G6R0_9FLAO|nr:N-acetylglucosamine kinase [Aequorivita sp. H23M31]QAA82967.1 N-acetylglucosamine kinase [Aequorivita sp. H23M31]
MTLITDGGSTKCDWVLLDSNGEIVFKTKTLGLNPAVIQREELISRISANETLQEVFSKVNNVDFYGAGCGTATPNAILKEVLQGLFNNAQVNVSEDLAAAVFSVTTEPGIVCILGTGSNSCYFDGKEIHAPIPSLGYMLMDEAGGNYFGKRMIRDYYYKRMPAEIASNFEKKYDLEADTIKKHLYKEPNPGAYLASFAQIIFEQKDFPPYYHSLLKEGITDFIVSRILTFENASSLPIHFIGSIAYFSKEVISECLKENNLKLGNVIQRPIDGLIEYYRKKLLD